MKNFDYIFTGGGCAALSTVLHLVREGLHKERILIIDKEPKVGNDRTWCYWSKKNQHPFPEIVSHSWPQLAFADQDGELVSSMKDYQYHLVRSSDFYALIKNELASHDNIVFLHADVQKIQKEGNGLAVKAGDHIYYAPQVLNSIVSMQQIRPKEKEYLLFQHFMGWFIESEDASFEVGKAHLMDFRTPQNGQTRFFYVLPFSKNKALVEFTAFSKDLLADHQYRLALTEYINDVLDISSYSIEEEEFGIIPMTNAALVQQKLPGLIHIGTAGAQVKPTTGYAFLKIQKAAKELAKQLLENSNNKLAEEKSRFIFYDNLLLHILNEDAGQGRKIFSALFRSNPMYRILDFLSEKSWLSQEALIFLHLPFKPFVNAVFERMGLKKEPKILNREKTEIGVIKREKN